MKKTLFRLLLMLGTVNGSMAFAGGRTDLPTLARSLEEQMNNIKSLDDGAQARTQFWKDLAKVKIALRKSTDHKLKKDILKQAEDLWNSRQSARIDAIDAKMQAFTEALLKVLQPSGGTKNAEAASTRQHQLFSGGRFSPVGEKINRPSGSSPTGPQEYFSHSRTPSPFDGYQPGKNKHSFESTSPKEHEFSEPDAYQPKSRSRKEPSGFTSRPNTIPSRIFTASVFQTLTPRALDTVHALYEAFGYGSPFLQSWSSIAQLPRLIRRASRALINWYNQQEHKTVFCAALEAMGRFVSHGNSTSGIEPSDWRSILEAMIGREDFNITYRDVDALAAQTHHFSNYLYQGKAQAALMQEYANLIQDIKALFAQRNLYAALLFQREEDLQLHFLVDRATMEELDFCFHKAMRYNWPQAIRLIGRRPDFNPVIDLDKLDCSDQNSCPEGRAARTINPLQYVISHIAADDGEQYLDLLRALLSLRNIELNPRRMRFDGEVDLGVDIIKTAASLGEFMPVNEQKIAALFEALRILCEDPRFDISPVRGYINSILDSWAPTLWSHAEAYFPKTSSWSQEAKRVKALATCCKMAKGIIEGKSNQQREHKNEQKLDDDERVIRFEFV